MRIRRWFWGCCSVAASALVIGFLMTASPAGAGPTSVLDSSTGGELQVSPGYRAPGDGLHVSPGYRAPGGGLSSGGGGLQVSDGYRAPGNPLQVSPGYRAPGGGLSSGGGGLQVSDGYRAQGIAILDAPLLSGLAPADVSGAQEVPAPPTVLLLGVGLVGLGLVGLHRRAKRRGK